MNFFMSLHVVLVITLISTSVRVKSEETSDDSYEMFLKKYAVKDEDTEDTEESDLKQAASGDNGVSCEKMIDIGFVLDSSDSVGPVNFRAMKAYVKKILDNLDLIDCDRTGLVKFTDFANSEMLFTSYHTKLDIFATVDGLLGPEKQRDTEVDQTRVDYGLLMADVILFTPELGLRNASEKYLVLMTDGKLPKLMQISKAEKSVLKKLDRKGVQVFALVIGNESSQTEHFKDIYKKQNVFSENQIDQLISRIFPSNLSSNKLNHFDTSKLNNNETYNSID